jgi:hypothetical protein
LIKAKIGLGISIFTRRVPANPKGATLSKRLTLGPTNTLNTHPRTVQRLSALIQNQKMGQLQDKEQKRSYKGTPEAIKEELLQGPGVRFVSCFRR